MNINLLQKSFFLFLMAIKKIKKELDETDLWVSFSLIEVGKESEETIHDRLFAVYYLFV